MIRIVLADLRHSWRIWIGALVLLTVVQVLSSWIGALTLIGALNANLSEVVSLSATTGGNADAPVHSSTDGVSVGLLATGLVSAIGICGIILAVVMIMTIRSVATLIVTQRRRLLALWQLSGMTDRQSGRILNLQFVALGVVASVLGAAIAAPLLGGVLHYIGSNGLFSDRMSISSIPVGIAVGLGFGLLIMLAGSAGAGREIRSVRPIEAIQGAGSSDLRMTRGRWIWSVLLFALAAGAYSGTFGSTKQSDVFSSALIGSLLLVSAFSVAGPLTFMAFLRGWTSLVPRRVSVSWFLARSALRAASTRFVASVVPIAVSTVLLTGMYSLSASLAAAFAATGKSPADDGNSLFGTIVVIGLPVIVSITGAAVLVFMAGQQREKEIALGALAGATPRQQLLQAVFEAIIVVVTGVVAGMVGVLIGVAALQGWLVRTLGEGGFAISWPALGLITGFVLVVNLTATILPTAIAQRGANLRLVAAT
jgi:putative ABC transport system permease protein